MTGTYIIWLIDLVYIISSNSTGFWRNCGHLSKCCLCSTKHMQWFCGRWVINYRFATCFHKLHCQSRGFLPKTSAHFDWTINAVGMRLWCDPCHSVVVRRRTGVSLCARLALGCAKLNAYSFFPPSIPTSDFNEIDQESFPVPKEAKVPWWVCGRF